jgi:hypothetical protein
MPKVKWGINPDEPEELEQYDIYDGPDLRTGVYAGNIMRLTVVENRSKDDMLKVMFQVDETGDKAKYNGAVLWSNQNVTDQSKPYLLAFLKAIGLTWDDFTKRSVLEDAKERPTKVLKIGRVKFNDGNEVPCRVQVGLSKATPDYPERKPEIKSWLTPRDVEEWDDSDADEDADDKASASPFG